MLYNTNELISATECFIFIKNKSFKIFLKRSLAIQTYYLLTQYILKNKNSARSKMKVLLIL